MNILPAYTYFRNFSAISGGWFGVCGGPLPRNPLAAGPLNTGMLHIDEIIASLLLGWEISVLTHQQLPLNHRLP